jgi:hypothetical protein
MSHNSQGFVGDWLVSEYLYTPAGEYVGVIRQRRQLEPLAEGVIRLLQVCEPVAMAEGVSATAVATAAILNQRVGEFVFDLQLVGQARHYLGPDVLGGGFAWRDGVLTARGLWPRFGYNFTSFSILLHPELQLTGGKFFTANAEVATIMGTAVPATNDYPELSLTPPPSTQNYHGTQYTIAPDGTPLHEETLRIHHTPISAPHCAKQYGCLREIVAVTAPGRTLAVQEMYDAETACLVGLGQQFQDEKLQHVQFYRLTAVQ